MSDGSRKDVFLFFTLARELRDQIYDELWRFGPSITLRHHGLNFQVQYDGDRRPDEDQRLPTWLLADKTMLKEGLEQLHGKAKCIWYKESRLHRQDTLSPLILPSAFRDLTIKYWYLEKNKGAPHDDRGHCRTSIDMGYRYNKDVERLSQLVQTSNLKVLRLHFAIDVSEIMLCPSLWGIDLSPMLQFPRQLEKLEVVAQVSRHPRDMAVFDVFVAPALKQEVTKIGIVLVGGKAQRNLTVSECEVAKWRIVFIKEDTQQDVS